MKLLQQQSLTVLSGALALSSAALLVIVLTASNAYAESYWVVWQHGVNGQPPSPLCDHRPTIDQQCVLDGCSSNTHGEFVYWWTEACECRVFDDFGC
jgi:hypothetical protein